MPPFPTVRPRTEADLAACVRGLAEVHRAHGYPVNWPADPPSWSSPDGSEPTSRVHLSPDPEARVSGSPSLWDRGCDAQPAVRRPAPSRVPGSPSGHEGAQPTGTRPPGGAPL